MTSSQMLISRHVHKFSFILTFISGTVSLLASWSICAVPSFSSYIDNLPAIELRGQ